MRKTRPHARKTRRLSLFPPKLTEGATPQRTNDAQVILNIAGNLNNLEINLSNFNNMSIISLFLKECLFFLYT